MGGNPSPSREGGAATAKGERKRPLRERVLDAAERVVDRDGAAHLTLDAVVAEAGVSKGGMLYHFRSKDALLQGLLTRTVERHGKRVNEIQASLPEDETHARARARVLGCIEREPLHRDLGITLLAASAHDPQLLEPVRPLIREAEEDLRGLETEVPLARLLWFAMHGMYFFDILDISPLSDDEKRTLRDQARRILAGTGETQ